MAATIVVVTVVPPRPRGSCRTLWTEAPLGSRLLTGLLFIEEPLDGVVESDDEEDEDDEVSQSSRPSTASSVPWVARAPLGGGSVAGARGLCGGLRRPGICHSRAAQPALPGGRRWAPGGGTKAPVPSGLGGSGRGSERAAGQRDSGRVRGPQGWRQARGTAGGHGGRRASGRACEPTTPGTAEVPHGHPVSFMDTEQ